MKFTVVGYWHGYPEAGEASSGYLLEKDGFRLLIDCGSGVVSHLQKYCPLDQLDALIVSHYHHDHFSDIGVLQYARLVHNAWKGEEKKLIAYGHLHNKEKYNLLSYEPHVTAIPYNPAKVLNVGPFSISFLQTKHPEPCFAMKITDGNTTIVYTADTSYFQELHQFALDSDLLIAECTFYEHQDPTAAGHMNSRDVGILAKNANAKQLLLTHLPHFGDHNELTKQVMSYYDGQTELAKTGWTFEK
ncbi:MBL fold metallo-hydrolase [Alkalihalobacillus sp. BA299]|uniref:MBL fold metallo-hydrolase n=1 Tax=Alkalihalobacillus sp. BA299 TaxID=2815938 RepID=UPI001ADAEC32|nr:MBL fold metallo-hydrolase [Alkalihalobacillus sp. BA299]